MEWAEKIKCIENELGISEERGRLARLIGVRPGIISDIKTGKSKQPSANIPLLLITILGVNPEWLENEKQPIFIDLNWLKRQPWGRDLTIKELNKQLNDEKVFNGKAEKTASFSLFNTAAGSTVKTTPNESITTGVRTENRSITVVKEETDATLGVLREITRHEIPVVVDGGAEEGLLIPVITQSLSAGFGFDYDEGETIRYIKVPAWIARSGRDLVALPVYGDSMEPTISNGDLVVCDSGGFCGDGLYMLRDEDRGLMFCKRVVWAPDGWTIKSDNPSYEPMKVGDHVIHIVARIIATIKGAK